MVWGKALKSEDLNSNFHSDTKWVILEKCLTSLSSFDYEMEMIVMLTLQCCEHRVRQLCKDLLLLPVCNLNWTHNLAPYLAWTTRLSIKNVPFLSPLHDNLWATFTHEARERRRIFSQMVKSEKKKKKILQILHLENVNLSASVFYTDIISPLGKLFHSLRGMDSLLQNWTLRCSLIWSRN